MTTHTEAERAEFEDGAWYWVEKDGWIGDPPTITPALYKAASKAWYSFAFSGIPTRQVKVLEPCRRAPAAPVPQEWLRVNPKAEPVPKYVYGDKEALLDVVALSVALEDAKRLIAAAPQPPDEERRKAWMLACEKVARDEMRPAAPQPPEADGRKTVSILSGKEAVFAIDILGGPMREYATGKWENAVWPSEAAPVQMPDALLTLETDAHCIFNNPPGETPQAVRDVIEWYAASVRQLLEAQARKPLTEEQIAEYVKYADVHGRYAEPFARGVRWGIRHYERAHGITGQSA